MSRLYKVGFERDGETYELAIAWDDAAFADGVVAIDVTASRAKSEHPEDRDELNVTTAVETDGEERPILAIKFQGETVASIPLDELFDESQLIDRIPSFVFGGDPMLGCLVRSGLSASIGQIISCRNETAGVEWVRPRMSEIARCVRGNVPNLCATAAFRAARCSLSLGF